MTNQSWRSISAEEDAVIRTIVSRADVDGSDVLTVDLEAADVAADTAWIVDIRVSRDGGGANLPDGPFPARAFVPSSANYQGEVIIWITDGHRSGLEYARVTDAPPSGWPMPDEIEVVVER